MELLPVIMSDTTSHLKHKVIEKKLDLNIFQYMSELSLPSQPTDIPRLEPHGL